MSVRRLLPLVLCALALAGCTSARPPLAPAPEWNARTAAGAGRLFVMRTSVTASDTDVLEAVDLRSGRGIALWSAPAGYDARLLCADESRIAIALSKRGASNVVSKVTTTTNGVSVHERGVHVDQPILLLRADGGITTGSVPAASTGVVNSGAFVGRDLLLGVSGPQLHYPTFSPPLLMAANGAVRRLTVRPLSRYGIALGSVFGLAGGTAAGRFEGFGPPGPFGEKVSALTVHGSSVAAEAQFPPGDALRQLDSDPVGAGTPGRILFAQRESHATEVTGSFDLVEASLGATGTSVVATAAWSAAELPYVSRPIAPLPDGGYLIEVGHPKEEATWWKLARLDVDGRRSLTPVALHRHPRTPPRPPAFGEQPPALPVAIDTWAYVDRFGD